MTIKNWTEWLKGCSEAWKNQGNPRTNRGKEVRNFLTRADKKPGDNLMEVAAKAWKLYKKEKF